MNALALRLAAFAWLTVSSVVAGLESEGFTEPFRTINVASDETGTIAEVFVREGDAIQLGQPLVRLSSEIHLAQLAIARQAMLSEGRLDAARAEYELRKERFEKLTQLRAAGHAQQEEVKRAAGEVTIAEANLRAAREDLLLRKLEFERIAAQIERRTVRAPASGTITQLHKQPGEFMAPNSPVVLTLVELDPLLATFTLLSPQAATLAVGQEIAVRFPLNAQSVSGTIDFIAPTTDAESGTVRVKVRLENANGRLRSGERCQLSLPH